MKSKRKSVVHTSVSASSLRQMDSSIMSGIASNIAAHDNDKADDVVESVTIARSFFEYLMIGYGSLISLEAPLLGIVGAWFYAGAGAWIDDFYIRIGIFVAAAPVVGMFVILWMMISAILVKKILVGDFSTFVGEDEYLPETHLKVFRWRLTYLWCVTPKNSYSGWTITA